MSRILVHDDSETTKPFSPSELPDFKDPELVQRNKEVFNKIKEPIVDNVIDIKEQEEKDTKKSNNTIVIVGLLLVAVIVGAMIYENYQENKGE